MGSDLLSIGFDASILGRGYFDSRVRTGIHRYIKCLFHELIIFDDIILKGYSLNSDYRFTDLIFTEFFLKKEYRHHENTYNSLVRIDFKGNSFQSKLYSEIIRLFKSLDANRGIYSKAQRSLLAKSINILGIFYLKQKIKKSYNSLPSVYHSSFLGLPELPKRIARVVTIYDLIPVKYPSYFTKSILSQYSKMLSTINIQKDWVCCISENTKYDFCEYTKMNSDRVFVTPLAADKNLFYRFNHPDLQKDILTKYDIAESPYILSLSTIEPRKNLPFLIRSFCRLLQCQPGVDINLVLVGGLGWKTQEFFSGLEIEKEVKERIKILGFVPDMDLSAIYSNALAFVFPSRYEGFGLPPLEAMQCGTPVITSNTSSLPEVVGDAGIMINPSNEDELCQAILDIITNDNLRQMLSEKGLEKAKQFSWRRCAEETVKVYKLAADNV